MITYEGENKIFNYVVTQEENNNIEVVEVEEKDKESK